MGSERLFKNKISSINIEYRNEVLKADKKKNQNFPQQSDNEFSQDSKFNQGFHFGGNKKSLKQDFVVLHSSVEGKSNTKIFIKHTNLK